MSLLNKVLEARSKGLPPRTAAILALLAMVAVIVFSARSVRSLDLQWSDIDRGAAVLCAMIGLLQIPLNASEYRLSSRLADVSIDWRTSIRTTTIASAMNILPLPTGAFVRVQGLRAGGAGTVSSVAGTTTIATTWLGISALVASSVLFGRGSVAPALGFLLLLAIALLVGVAAASRCPNHSWRLILMIAGLESVYVMFAATRFWLALRTLNVSASFSDAMVIASGSPVASAAGVIPGAVGLLEGLAAGAAKLVNLPGASGFLSAALLRAFGFATSGLALLWVGADQLTRWRRSVPSERIMEKQNRD